MDITTAPRDKGLYVIATTLGVREGVVHLQLMQGRQLLTARSAAEEEVAAAVREIEPWAPVICALRRAQALRGTLAEVQELGGRISSAHQSDDQEDREDLEFAVGDLITHATQAEVEAAQATDRPVSALYRAITARLRQQLEEELRQARAHAPADDAIHSGWLEPRSTGRAGESTARVLAAELSAD